MNKKFWATTFTLSGTIIGAGILALPYVFAESGFIAGLFWLIFLGGVMTFINLCMGEVTLRTKGYHQLTGYAEKYLGKWGKRIMFFSMVFGLYSALIAYLVGEGRSISEILPWSINPLVIGFLFWILMNLLIREGLRGLKKVETYAVLVIIILVFVLFIRFAPQIETSNVITFNSGKFFIPMGVVLFALLGFVSIPKLREEIKGNEKLFKRAIIIGSLIPVLLNILFSAVFVGVLGGEVSEVATLSFGPLVTLIGIFTMFSAYFVLSFALKDTFKYDFKLSKITNFLFYSAVPIILYIIVERFALLSFTLIIGIGGLVSGGLMGILIILMNYKAKKSTRNGKKPEINISIGLIGVIILSLIFITGVVLSIFF
jgi:amino acid permease